MKYDLQNEYVTVSTKMDPSSLSTISPSRYITFSFPSPSHNHNLLRIAVLDSPSATSAIPATAAMWVPPGRETDWVFSTFSGHIQLLHSSTVALSRLILVGNSPLHSIPTSFNHSNNKDSSFLVKDFNKNQEITPLLLALTPKSCFGDNGEIPDIPFMFYDDGVVKNSILEVFEGCFVGEMLVENVELESDGGGKEYRRRLRFKRMPNLVQTQVRIRPKKELVFEEGLDGVEFELDDGVLVHPYLSPMVAGISVVSEFVERRVVDDFRPRALCLGIGGGALLGFLSGRLGFEVVGVEEDEVVLDVAKKYFGLESNEFLDLNVGDGMEFVRNLGKESGLESKLFDVVMVDLDSSDGDMGVSAPPLEFVKKYVLESLRMVLYEHGVVIINTIPSSKNFYEGLVREFGVVFEELYEIDVGNGDNLVLIATKSNTGNALNGFENNFLSKLKSAVSESYINTIRKITNSGSDGERTPPKVLQ